MLVKVARIESAHMMIAFHTTIHDGFIPLLPDTFSCDVQVRPARIAPHISVDLTKFDRRTRMIVDCFLEGLVEIAIIEEDIRVMEPAVEMALHRFDGLYHAFKLRVPCKYYKSGIGTGTICLRI